ncbi:uncharacterized protein LOC110030135 isoform X4 [Phalaenopsis equestris]|nr:uncharacterized protein LOC110030135 isoform X4 [Phalaenopsis equestris]
MSITSTMLVHFHYMMSSVNKLKTRMHVVGSMGRDSQSLLLLTLGRSLKELGYVLSAFALEDGEARTLWENIYCYVTVLGYNHSILIDWTRFEGALLSSLETERVISRSDFLYFYFQKWQVHFLLWMDKQTDPK